MSGRCIEKLPHKTDVCNSSDGLQVFENADGTYTGFCFACNTFVSDPYNGGKPSENLAKYSIDHDKWFKEILSLKTFEVKQRALTEETLQHFGVKVALNQEDGKTPVVMYFPFTKQPCFRVPIKFNITRSAKLPIFKNNKLANVPLFSRKIGVFITL